MPTLPVKRADNYFQLALSSVEGIGVISARKLINHFGSAREVFSSSSRDLMGVQGMITQKAMSIRNFNGFDRIDQEFEFAEKHNISILSFRDKEYPKRLNHCIDAPIVLFKKGNANLDTQRMVSVVGTRRMSEYGKKVTRDLVKSFSPYGITVVSGLAAGVDIQAHLACLDFGLPTIAVLGHGLDRIYPSSHTKYARKIVGDGALLTEFSAGTTPDRENFPKRNRIVAGMTDATIVIESGFKGGSIITADLANSYNRDVFAIPGRINDQRSAGCNRLIKSNRAAILESVKDLETIMGWKLDEKKPPIQKKIFVELKPEEEALINFLSQKGKIQIDDISLGMDMPMSTVMVNLLNLELNGLVRSLPGKEYELS